MTAAASARERWQDAVLAARLLAVDPATAGGVLLRARPGPVRDAWLLLLDVCLPLGTPSRRVPLHIDDGRLIGGLDLAATLRSGAPVVERGLLADVHGGVAILAMAERLGPGAAARFAAVLDAGEVVMERDGIAMRMPARCGVVALDESAEEEERVPFSLTDRLAFDIDLREIGLSALSDGIDSPGNGIREARDLLPKVRTTDDVLEGLCAAATAMGIDSLRVSLRAVQVARLAAALAGRAETIDEDALVAARLVLAPRATRMPTPQDESDSEPAPPEEAADADPSPQENNASDSDSSGEGSGDPLDDRIVAAAQAALPADVLAKLLAGGAARSRQASAGRAGQQAAQSARGRVVGVRRGDPRGPLRLGVIETLRVAAPWKSVRARERATSGSAPAQALIDVRREDFRVVRRQHRTGTTTIFVVDASGSSALHRLAEAKGAVELLLADCYVRRDQVALVAFRGRSAELLLPPTRSLTRVKRSLAGLPGGGGTPLACGIDAAVTLAESVARKGDTPMIVLMTDGRANIGREGTTDRAQAARDAVSAARRVRLAGYAAVLVDTSPRPGAAAAEVAAEMGARYLPLPYADAAVVSRAIRAGGSPSAPRARS